MMKKVNYLSKYIGENAVDEVKKCPYRAELFAACGATLADEYVGFDDHKEFSIFVRDFCQKNAMFAPRFKCITSEVDPTI